MASLQHVYRRGHIFWWRRVHFSFHTNPIDVRLSLGTPDRRQARNRGAALTAAYDRVVETMAKRLRGEHDLTDRKVQKIAHAIYCERLLEVCHEQRMNPSDWEYHSAANHAFFDYFDRQARHGGNLSLLECEEAALRRDGWDDQRIADFRAIIRLRDRGLDPVRPENVDRHIHRAGFLASDSIRNMVALAAYPALRDAYLDAELSLLGGGVSLVGETERSPSSGHEEVACEQPERSEWLTLTPSQVAERMIAETPKLLDHRRGGKREKDSIGEQTLRQIRWAAVLLEKSLPPAAPLHRVTKADILNLDRLLDRLPITFGKSVRDRDPGVTLEMSAKQAEQRVANGDLSAENVGLSTGTTNKHFNKLGQIHKFLCANDPSTKAIVFSEFTAPIAEDERDARLRYTREQGQAIFSLPPWTGCKELTDRLSPGSVTIHDGLYYVLLLVWYTGARREEICKLMLDDVESRHGYDYLLIRPSKSGRVKNRSAIRIIAIADELVRLGFIRYVEAMRAAGETLLFPELMPGGDTKRKFGDVFYKLWWIYLRPLVPNLSRGQAMHAARHMVSDEMKDQEVFVEFRNDHLGHRGKGGEGESRYPSRASLERLKELVEKIPVVTDHLPDQTVINLLSPGWRRGSPKRQVNNIRLPS